MIVVTGCVACNGNPQQSAVQQPDTATTPARMTVTLPNEKPDSIQLEGGWQPITLKLVKPASSVPFVTYTPSDMIAESTGSGEGEAHYFYANFAGRRNNDAFLLIFILPPGTAEEDAVRLARAFKSSRQRPGFTVTTTLRRHGDRFYYLAEHYPGEYAEGFGPRSRKIQDEWQWLAPAP